MIYTNKNRVSAQSNDTPYESYRAALKSQSFLIHIADSFLSALLKQETNSCNGHLKNFTRIFFSLKPLCKDQKLKSLPISYDAMYKNIAWTIDRLFHLLAKRQEKKAKDLTEFQLIPFLKEWKEDTYFWLFIYPDKEKMDQYYKNEFVEHHKNTDTKRGENYLISIFIPVYNKVDYTKKCLESLFRTTDLEKYPCELILLNDGSTDGTEEYFDQLPIRKVITLKENVKTMIFSLMYRVCEGKYAVFVNNDTILTSHWLDNLLACIRSDPKIVMVTPSTPNTSNRQSMTEELTPENVEEKAKLHNQSNPYLWEERCRLMPVIALYDMDHVDTIGFADRYFYTMEFWDDDFSLRARRAGLKQILLKDTWCYHFGSVSGKADQLKSNTLLNGRALFLKKHGLDPWDHHFVYDPYQLTHIEEIIPSQPEELSVLEIDPGYGADALQLQTQVRRAEKKASFSFLLTDSKFAPDLCPFQSSIALSPSALETNKYIPEGIFHFIRFGKDLSLYPDYKELLTACTSQLATTGSLTFYVKNPYSLDVKKGLKEETLLNANSSMTLIPISGLLLLLNQLGVTTKVRGILGSNLPKELNSKQTEHLDRYFVLCTKKQT